MCPRDVTLGMTPPSINELLNGDNKVVNGVFARVLVDERRNFYLFRRERSSRPPIAVMASFNSSIFKRRQPK